MSDPASRGRPRRAETDRRIVDAGLELLRTRGPEAVNVDAVAARSGVARTTVYRRYRSREELMHAVVGELVEADLPAPDLAVPAKLRWVLDRVLAVLEDGIGRGGTAAVLTDSDPAFTTALRARLEERLGALEEAVAADARAGRLHPRVEPATLVGLLLGAYLGEVLRHGRPRRGWADRVVALLGPAVAPREPGQHAGPTPSAGPGT